MSKIAPVHNSDQLSSSDMFQNGKPVTDMAKELWRNGMPDDCRIRIVCQPLREL